MVHIMVHIMDMVDMLGRMDMVDLVDMMDMVDVVFLNWRELFLFEKSKIILKVLGIWYLFFQRFL